MQTPSRLSRGYAIALAATALWSFTGIFISYLSRNYSLPSLVLALWRDLFLSGGLALGLFFISREHFHLDRVHWRFIVIYGFTLAIFNSGHSRWNTTARRLPP
jgi:drug/metabolite transporter (DMT)-like permease